MTRERRLLAIPAALAVAGMTLAACSGNTPDQATSATQSGGEPLTVMTSFYPLQYLVDEIGGDLVSVESLTPPGGEPHDLELTPAKVQAIGASDVVVYLSGFQSAVDETVAANPPANVVDVASAVQLLEGTHEHEADTAASGEQGTDHDHEAETAASGEESTDHEHATDPHFWLDPTRMGQAATLIGQALANADPANAQTYTTNAGAVKKAMDELSTELVQGTAQCTHTTFVTSHEAFGYLADRTGLTQVGISGLDPDSSPSPARLQEIADLVKAEGVTTIFTEALIDPKVAETLATDLGITTAVLDPIENQSDPAKDYAEVMRENIEALRTALDCK